VTSILDASTVAIVGVFLGCLIRTVIAFLNKLQDKPDLQFDKRFAVTSAITFISAIALAITLIPSLQIPEGVPIWLIFASAFTFAYTTNDLVNMTVK
jgi:heme/copper-type cytochrome/quinol oxidase subunit 2